MTELKNPYTFIWNHKEGPEILPFNPKLIAFLLNGGEEVDPSPEISTEELESQQKLIDEELKKLQANESYLLSTHRERAASRSSLPMLYGLGLKTMEGKPA